MLIILAEDTLKLFKINRRSRIRENMWWIRYKLEPGDIVTEIKMNVGQNGNSRSPLSSLASGNSRSSLPTLARVPQPIDVSTAPLAGMPRGPPIISNIVTRRPNPVTVRTHHTFLRILKKVVFSIKITAVTCSWHQKNETSNPPIHKYKVLQNVF